MKDQRVIFNKLELIVDDNIGYFDPTVNINEYAPYSSILTIYNLTLSHNGNYTCQISNQAGSVEYSAVLSVSGLLMK